MQKRKHEGREIRYLRSKRQGREWNDQQKHIPSSHVLTASGRFEQDRHIMTDERKRGATSSRLSRLLQDENVQRWLDQTTQETDAYRRENVSQRVGSSGLSRELDSVKFPRARVHDSNIGNAKARGTPSKRKLDLSSDSSFLEYALAYDPRPEILLRNNVVNGIERKENLETSHRFPSRERLVDLGGSAVSLSIKTQDDSFDKRRRHKTKLDRYEPKRALVDHKSKVDKGYKANGKRSQSRRKLQKNTAGHIMHQFSSEKVGLDRLTMRPGRTAGLFKNGRASSQTRRRGLPDLAFSEMDFLRRPKQCSAKIEYKVSFPKSRENDRLRSERAHNEISQYFKPYTESCDEVKMNQARMAKKISKPDCKSHQEGAEDSSNQPSPSRSIEQLIGSSTKPFLDQDHPLASERLVFGPHLHRRPVKSGVTSDMTMVLSNGEGSYYAWSNSGNSPRVSQRNQESCSVASTTPEQVRIMMNETGIFKDTGIDRTTARMHDIARKRHSTSNLLKNTSELSNTRSSDSSTEQTHKASRANTRNRAHIEKWESVPRNQPSPRALKPGSLGENTNTIRDENIPCTTKSITQHTRQNFGVKEYSGGRDSVSHPHISQAEHSQRNLSRHEIAQMTYITHSATTSTAVHANESLERAPVSSGTPGQEISLSHQKPAKQVASGEINADTFQLLDVGPKKPQEGHCINGTNETNGTGDSAICQALHHQPLEALSSSVAPADQQDKTMQLNNGLRVPYRTPEVINNIANTYPGAESSMNHVGLSGVRQETRASLHRPLYKGLPVRGSWPDQVTRPVSSHLNVNLPGEAGFLYSRQAHNNMPYGLSDQSYRHNILQRQSLHSYGTSLNMENDDTNNRDTLDSNHKLFSDTEDMQENHIVVSNDVEFVAPESLQEEEPSLWADHDISPLTARTDHDFYEYSYTANSLNQRCLPVPGSNFNWERNHLHSSHELAQRLTQAEDLGESYKLRRFWQPRLQY